MKAEDVIAVLKANIPRFTDQFSETISVTSITQAGGVATATTPVVHALETGDIVTVLGALSPNPISALTQAGGVATATTTINHDLTEGFQTSVELRGATESEYNGTHTLLSVPNRRTFTFEVDSGATSPATGTPELLEDRITGYGGLVSITITGTTTFTYPVDSGLGTPAGGTITVATLPRITGAASESDAALSYTEQTAQDDLWMFVIAGQVIANKSRETDKDITIDTSVSSDVKQFASSELGILVFSPVQSSIANREQRDDMEDVFAAILSSIGTVEFPTYLGSDDAHSLVFVDHGPLVQIGEDIISAYIHGFNFEQGMYLTREDMADPADSVAFRDVLLTLQRETGEQLVTATANLDDEPL